MKTMSSPSVAEASKMLQVGVGLGLVVDDGAGGGGVRDAGVHRVADRDREGLVALVEDIVIQVSNVDESSYRPC